MRIDDDTGVVTREIQVDGPLTAADAAELCVHMRGRTLDEVLSGYERTLRDSAPPLDDAVNILTRIHDLRMLVALNARGAHHTAPTEAVVVMALEVGSRVAEARAKAGWPAFVHGKKRRAQVRSWHQDGVAERRRKDSDALARDVAAYRKKKPNSTNAEIAKHLYSKYGDGRREDSLSRAIGRLRDRK
jgi:hypothetical protein